MMADIRLKRIVQALARSGDDYPGESAVDMAVAQAETMSQIDLEIARCVHGADRELKVKMLAAVLLLSAANEPEA